MSYGYGRINRPSYYGGAHTTSLAGYGAFYGEPLLSISTRAGNPSSTRELQSLLVSKGYSIAVDGDFGPNTQSAVRSYQAQVGLPATGIADQATWNSLKATGGSSSSASGSAAAGSNGQNTKWYDVLGQSLSAFGQGLFPGNQASAATFGVGTNGASSGSGSTASTTDDNKFPWGMVLLGVGGVAVIGGGIYFATRKKK